MIVAAPRPVERRPLASRDLAPVQRVTAWLIAGGVPANAVSLSSVAFAALASTCLAATAWTGLPARALLALAALFVQLRLLANLLDGMIAVGSGHASPRGELYNEVPDRVSDALILIGSGFAAGSTPALGYLAAVVALFVAYVRAFGTSVGVRALFIGPMAKPQRMATLTGACLYIACVPGSWPGALASDMPGAIAVALTLIIGGGVLTSGRRLRRIWSELGRQA